MSTGPRRDVPDGLLLPDYGPRSLRVVLPAVIESLGVELGEVRDQGPRYAELALPPSDRVCVVLVDGLGLAALVERSGHAPFLRSRLPEARELTVGFPSTTATSLASLGTGLPPGSTGLLGYTLRDPDSGRLMNMLSWNGEARPEEWQPAPTIFERLAAAGVEAVTVGQEKFRLSGLTRAAFRGGAFAAADTFADRVDAAVRALRARSRLVYVYWGDVDTVGHHKGWGSWEWGDEVERVDRELARLVRSVPSGTTVLVTADHGMVDVGHGDKIDIAATPALAEGVEIVAGEPRAVHVHCAPGATGRVAQRWRDVLGDTAWVLERAEAEALGLFGEVAALHRRVIGDLVVAARGRRAVQDSRVQTPPSMGLVGMHGSLTPDEMLVPLIVSSSR